MHMDPVLSMRSEKEREVDRDDHDGTAVMLQLPKHAAFISFPGQTLERRSHSTHLLGERWLACLDVEHRPSTATLGERDFLVHQ